MSDQQLQITRPEIEDALRRSGYLLESRIEHKLRLEHWHVEANAAYPDPITGKSRELDVNSLYAVQLFGKDSLNYLFAKLLIECVNNPQPIAFITKEALVPFLHTSEIMMAGIPVKVLSEPKGRSTPVSEIGEADEENKEWVYLSDFLHAEKYHHYCSGRISTQYCSFTSKRRAKSTEWMASHDENHFNSFEKLCACLDHDRENQFGWDPGEKVKVNIEVYYPLVVVQGGLLEVWQERDELIIEDKMHVHYVHSRIVEKEEIKCHIDIIKEEFFEDFLR